MRKVCILPSLFIALFLLIGCAAGATPVPSDEAAAETSEAATEEATPESAEADTPPAENGDETATEVAQAEAPTEEPTTAPTEEATEEAITTSAEEPTETPTDAPTDTPIPRPTPSEPFPPLVLETAPEQGQEQPLDEPVEITFDQPMDRASVESSFAIEPGATVDGDFEWVDDQTLRFAFDDGFARGERYRVRVVETAESQEGLPLTRPFELRFSAAGFLEVTNVIPADGTGEVEIDSTVTVMFNRPVVPLNAIEDQAELPDPLTFVPPVTGEGSWLNTATYQFTPDDGFRPATDYTARVSAGLTDVFEQAVLEDDFEWSFSTISPAVVASSPGPRDLNVSPTPVISVTFNQPMNRDNVEENFLLVEDTGGDPVSGEFAWTDSGIIPEMASGELRYDPNTGMPLEIEPEPIGVETVAFTPDEPLELGLAYQILLPAGVESELGTATQNDYSATFSVASSPTVLRTNPEDGEQFADVWQDLEITFNTPMEPASVKLGETLIIEADSDTDIKATEVYSYWGENNARLSVGFPRRENRTYSVTLGADITSRAGLPLGQAETITWQTLRQSPYVYLVSPKIATYNGYAAETYIYMTVRNVSQVNFELYRLSGQEFQNLSSQSARGWERGYEWDSFTPAPGRLLADWSQTVEPEEFVNHVYKVDVSQAVSDGDPLPPGLYYLEAFARSQDYYDGAQAEGPVIDRQLLIVSRNNLTLKKGDGDALVWLTNLESGQPVPDVPLTLIVPDSNDRSGVTDEEGVARFDFTIPEDTQWEPLFVFAGDPDDPDENFAVGSNGWNGGLDDYDFENLRSPGGQTFSRDYFIHLYTERPLYRPGQTVYFKGIVRADDDARYSIPTGQEQAKLIIRDAQYREIYNEDFPLNDWGTFNGSFELDEEASLGSYAAEVQYDIDPQSGAGGTAYSNFNVAEYRKPEFLVEADTDKAEYTPGETIELTVETEFFSGGPVRNAEVRWTLLSDDSYFQYTPSSGGGFYDFTNEENSRSNFFDPRFGFGFGEEIANGEGLTDREGRFTVEVPADITGALNSQQFTFDVAVTGLNNQEVATRAQAVVHKGDYYVGLRPAEYIGQVDQATEVELLVVDWRDGGQPVADQEVELVFARENWYSVQQLDPEASRLSPDDQFYWQNLVETEAVFSTTVTTDADGEAVAEFVPTSSGSYKVYARTIDSQGRALFSSTFLWISGGSYVNWGQEDHDRIELVPDLPEYSTGDTASILVPHPYSGTVTALVTIERGRIYDHFVTELESNSAQIEIPITEAMSPNAYVSVVVMQGGSPAGPPSPPEGGEDESTDAVEEDGPPTPPEGGEDESTDAAEEDGPPSPPEGGESEAEEEAPADDANEEEESGDEEEESTEASEEEDESTDAAEEEESDATEEEESADAAEEEEAVDDEAEPASSTEEESEADETAIPPAGGQEGLPSFKLGYARLNVDPDEKRLEVTLEPVTASNDGFYDAGQTVEYAVTVTDVEGNPVQAEVSLALIDKAVLTLFPETPGQLFDAFWERRALEVETGLGLTLALDRINRAIDARKGGGGGDGGLGPDSVRREFADTALWVADLVTDENGQATVETTLPDNLTTWVLIAKGVTGDETLVGEARDEIVTSKPLLVRPVAPRFFVVGDAAQLGLIVQNNTEEMLTVEPTFVAEGLEIGDWRLGDGEWQDSDKSASFEVEAGDEVKVDYNIVVRDVQTASLTMGATAAESDFEDGVAFALPVYQLSTPETVATVGVLEDDGLRQEGIALPASFNPDQGNLTVSVEPSLAAGMRDGLEYLRHFPYECTEQTVSRFLPNLFTFRAYEALDLERPDLAQNLPRQVSFGVQRLVSQQKMDGGWGWWRNSPSDPFLTAYVLYGLAEARRADFTVDQWVIDNAVSYLTDSLDAPQDLAEPWQANRQAFILYALAEAGEGELSRSIALFEQRAQLDMYGRAFLALAIHTLDDEAAQIDTLISDLSNGAIASATGAHWEEAGVDLRNMNSDTRSTAIILATLARIQPDHPLLPQAVRWLMTNREQAGHWSTTQETAWAIIGLTDWLVTTGELEADYAWQVSLNGQELGEGQVDAATVDEQTELRVEVEQLLADAVNRLAVERDPVTGVDDSPGNLYYAAYLTYYKPVEEVKALDRGIVVSRQYSLQDGDGQAITEAEVGDFITVKLTLIAPTDLRYVVVEDYLPAGVEAVDSSLATTSLVAEEPQFERVSDSGSQRPWGWWFFTHTDLRDEKAVLFADHLPQGVYEYSYTVRASLPGEYRVIPTHAEQMYFPEVFGRGDGGLFRVVE